MSVRSMSTLIKKVLWGTHAGADVFMYELSRDGISAKICTYGATLISLMVPDKSGVLGEVALGHDDLEVTPLAPSAADAPVTFHPTTDSFLSEPGGGTDLHGGHMREGGQSYCWRCRTPPGWLGWAWGLGWAGPGGWLASAAIFSSRAVCKAVLCAAHREFLRRRH